ncbi:MAG: Protein fmp52, mitochondrial [Claussenomyces sp. TS43310]|nr:MAG: Protein fmp52, mitochondrial [Claussenomyces sp. TS43310]
MASATVIGSTGLVGSRILAALLTLPSVGSVYTIARRQPTASDPKLQALIDSDTSQWASKFSTIQPPPSIFLSGLGTTRARAGGLDKQWAIDHDLNLEMAKAAKAAGVKVYVLISSTNPSASSSFPYLRMKGSLEDQVKALEFDQTVILRPGLIVGSREESRPAEAFMRLTANILGSVHSALKDPWAQDADVIGRAAVNAGLRAFEGKAPDKVWILNQSDIIKLGRTEWKME